MAGMTLSERAIDLIMQTRGTREIDPQQLPKLLVDVGKALRELDALESGAAPAGPVRSEVAASTGAKKQAPAASVAPAAAPAAAAPAPAPAPASVQAPKKGQVGRPRKSTPATTAPATAPAAAPAAPVAAAEPAQEPVKAEAPKSDWKGLRPPGNPAVPIGESVKDEYIVCLEDGQHKKMLKRHLRTAYDMTPEEYRAKWSLEPHYPMVAPGYARVRSRIAAETNFGAGQARA